jgi:hypothetical protein
MLNQPKKSGQSLEDAIRNVQQRYRNRPSPLVNVQENVHYIPTHVPDHMAVSKDFKDTLLGSFRPSKDTFR